MVTAGTEEQTNPSWKMFTKHHGFHGMTLLNFMENDVAM